MKSQQSSSPRSPVSVEKINILILFPYSRQIGTILPLMLSLPLPKEVKKVEEPSKRGSVMLLLTDFQKTDVKSTNILEGTALTRSNKKVLIIVTIIIIIKIINSQKKCVCCNLT